MGYYDPEHERERVMDAIAYAIMAGAVVALCILSGCGITSATWKTIGIDAAKCAEPAIVDAAGDALVALIQDMSAENVNFKLVGEELAQKYGVEAALCAIGKAWKDIQGAPLGAYGQPSRVQVTLQWLINNQSEWAKK